MLRYVKMVYDFENGPTAHVHHQIMQEVDRARLQAFTFVAQNVFDSKYSNCQQSHSNAILPLATSNIFTAENISDVDSLINMMIQEIAVGNHLRIQNTSRFLAMLKASSSEYILCMNCSCRNKI